MYRAPAPANSPLLPLSSQMADERARPTNVGGARPPTREGADPGPSARRRVRARGEASARMSESAADESGVGARSDPSGVVDSRSRVPAWLGRVAMRASPLWPRAPPPRAL